MPDAPVGNKIEIGETSVDTVSYFEAVVTTNITNTGGNKITEHGHCWSTQKEPTIENNKTALGKLEYSGEYNSELKNLLDNTSYHIRPYVTYSYGTI